jgi:hypothetical protein
MDGLSLDVIEGYNLLRRRPKHIPVGIGHEHQRGAVRFAQLHHGTLRAAAITKSQDRLPINHASKHTHLAVLIVEYETGKFICPYGETGPYQAMLIIAGQYGAIPNRTQPGAVFPAWIEEREVFCLDGVEGRRECAHEQQATAQDEQASPG